MYKSETRDSCASNISSQPRKIQHLHQNFSWEELLRRVAFNGNSSLTARGRRIVIKYARSHNCIKEIILHLFGCAASKKRLIPPKKLCLMALISPRNLGK
ncbi:unnamed protein product [Fraxinus pennsylvanica]|uniref:Uncharacterized protein n=1 Tax=Fraxinus pennsylvanica TaxID=56036 RepID=A0AAD2EBM0_9LAMI|nr:unnamed protein product [Fraxinus pennsylvanica]